MLLTLFLVVLTYLLAAESFTHFSVSGRRVRWLTTFKAGALPVALFDVLVAAFALVIILGWILIYAKSHGRTIRMPEWVNTLQVRHLPAIDESSLSRCSVCETRPALQTCARSPEYEQALSLCCRFDRDHRGAAWRCREAGFVLTQIVLFFLVALLLPLFPLHGVYVTAAHTGARIPGHRPRRCCCRRQGLYGLANLCRTSQPKFSVARGCWHYSARFTDRSKL